MVENIPLRTHVAHGLTIEGYSRAAVQSCWRIAELKLGFDLGVQPWDFMGTATWFVSHTHLDHIAALPVYVSRRRMMKMDPPTIYMPEANVDGCLQLLRTFGRLDRGSMPCEIIGVKDGDEIELSRELVVNVVRTYHTVPSVGYVVHERRKKLKPEYTHLDGPQIRDLRMQGIEVSAETRIPIVGYTGDTSPPGLDKNPVFYQVRTLITEMTFLASDHRKDKIHKHGHMHLDDFMDRRDKFKNELIIAAHQSTRYTDRQAMHYLRQACPDMFDGRLMLWL